MPLLPEPTEPESRYALSEPDFAGDGEDDEGVGGVELDALESFSEPDSLPAPVSADFEADSLSLELEPLRPLADDDADRESVMYQPLPLKTMPTG